MNDDLRFWPLTSDEATLYESIALQLRRLLAPAAHWPLRVCANLRETLTDEADDLESIALSLHKEELQGGQAR